MIEDPLLPGASVHQYPVGTSLAWAMDDLARAYGMDVELIEVFDSEAHLARETWEATYPAAGVALYLKAVPGIEGAIAIFASVAGSWVSGLTFLGGGLLAQAVGLAVTFGIQAIANSFMSPDQPEIGNSSGPQRYSLSGAQNRLVQWGAIPIVMGRMRVTPPYGAVPYTEVRGVDQYLRMVFLWGRGPVRLSDIRIGNTPISSFQGVEIEHDLNGYSGLGLYPSDAAQQSLNVNCTHQWVTRTTEPDTDEFGVTITFPSGIYEITDEGAQGDLSFNVTAQYRKAGTAAWTTFYYISGEWERTDLVRLAANARPGARAQYEVRVLVNMAPGDKGRSDDGVLTALRSFRHEAPVNAPGIAKTALVIKASDQLNGAIDELNAIVERQIPIWNGVDWSQRGFSANPAALYRDVLTGPSNARPVTAANVADHNLGEWYEHCAALGLTYENYLDRQSVSAVLGAIATAGFASPTMYDDKFGVVIDRARDTVVQAITPRNSWGFAGQINAPEELQALRVQFRNRSKDYADDEVIVYAEGYSAANATLYEVVNPEGISTAAQGQLMGRFLLLSRILRAEPYQVSMDFEHLLARRGDLVAFSHDAALVGDVAGRIKAVDGTTLTVDEPVTFEAGIAYNVRVRTRDAQMLLLTAAGTGTTAQFEVSNAAGLNPGDLFMFGQVGSESRLCVISDIERGDDLQANIALLPYVPELYEAIDQGVHESNLSEPVGFSKVGPVQPRIVGVVSDERALPRSATGDVQPAILVYFDPGFAPAGNARVTRTQYMLVSWRETGADEWRSEIVSALAGEVRISGVTARRSYDIQLVAQDAEFRTSEAALVSGHVVTGLAAPPPAVATFRTSANGSQVYLEWTYPAIVGDVVGYEIRYHPDQGVTDWRIMSRVADNVPRAARSIMAPSTVGSYAIKPFDALGIRSVEALYLSSAISDPALTNVIAVLSDAPDFAGVRDGVTFLDGGLQLDGSAVMADWATLDEVENLLRPYGNDTPLNPVGTYTLSEPFDLTGVYTVHADFDIRIEVASYRALVSDWANLSDLADLTGGVTGDEYSVEVQMRYSREDVASGFTWSEWQTFRPGEITARHLDFRAVLETTDPAVSPSIEALTVSIDVPDRVARGDEITSGAGAKPITFSPAFTATPSITVTAQDMQAGDYQEITGKSREGFTVTFRNQAGTAVSRTFDWQAIGYGRELGT
ncbi:Phage-related protein, tail component [Alloyangia pacifica]|uniref:Phage-related protein, tail component n=2 Tax=Alloyangia pacifica TaxID=311180 RepID=A0A1I6QK47_9RHOB|nr:Phage-related protein, tail component [Alloyangia pacifica]SFS52819.1 Phage-related protein, tail component [Alloyangia pacifica]